MGVRGKSKGTTHSGLFMWLKRSKPVTYGLNTFINQKSSVREWTSRLSKNTNHTKNNTFFVFKAVSI